MSKEYCVIDHYYRLETPDYFVSLYINLFEILATGQAIASRLRREEESPDSTEQCTGEEPGLTSVGTDSATENNLIPKG